MEPKAPVHVQLAFSRLAVGAAADDLRFLLPFGTDRDRFLLTRGPHSIICRLKRRAFGQVGALDPHVDDLGAIFLRFAVQGDLDIVHHSATLG